MSSFATMLRAPNPGPMTLDGTNTWVLRAPGHAGCVVVDPGPADAGHLDAIVAAGPVEMIMLTHRHHDHAEGVDDLLGRLANAGGANAGGADRDRADRDGADRRRGNRGGERGTVPVFAADPSLCRGGGAPIRDGDRYHLAGLTVDALATPGHTDDSVCLVVSSPDGERAMLTGDTILGRGTTVVAWPDGDLGEYLATLRRLAGYSGVPVLPGHGPALPDCGAIARDYLAHREDRLVQVRAALGAGARTPAEVVAHVYPDLEPVLVPAAEWTVRAALAYLKPGTRPAPGTRREPGP